MAHRGVGTNDYLCANIKQYRSGLVCPECDMAKEIERKFLVTSGSYLTMAAGRIDIVQAYLNRDPRATVRVRIAGDRAFLTVKGVNDGAVRDEWEYGIPLGDARQIVARCASGAIIEKTRWLVDFGGFRWEVDEFHGDNSGLVVAEIELPSADTPFDLPPFVGKEVTGDPRYYNSSL